MAMNTDAGVDVDTDTDMNNSDRQLRKKRALIKIYVPLGRHP
jgi:hypothetical protein